jgi:hypothetical protein
MKALPAQGGRIVVADRYDAAVMRAGEPAAGSGRRKAETLRCAPGSPPAVRGSTHRSGQPS